MGRFQETVNFHKRLERHELVIKKIPFPQREGSIQGDKRQKGDNTSTSNTKPKPAQTQESVDSEVRFTLFISRSTL